MRLEQTRLEVLRLGLNTLAYYFITAASLLTLLQIMAPHGYALPLLIFSGSCLLAAFGSFFLARSNGKTADRIRRRMVGIGV
jgi:hypothetical protein